MTPIPVADLSDPDSETLVKNLNRIMEAADLLINRHDADSKLAHEIYVRARDSRDSLIFDQVTRETVRRLQGDPDSLRIQGVEIPSHVIKNIRDGKLVDAIRDMRVSANLGLKEAKDICEAARDALGVTPKW